MRLHSKRFLMRASARLHFLRKNGLYRQAEPKQKANCFGFLLSAGNHAEILCDVYAALGRVHQGVPVSFGYSAEVKK